MQAHVTRFAPSPTGYLHLGHAFAAQFAAEAAGPAGRFLLRFEDIDQARCKDSFAQAIEEDLAWLGLTWEPPAWRQSEHLKEHLAALELLKAQRLVYPCFCTRAEIRAEIAHAGNAPQGPEGPLYPGTCRHLSPAARQERLASGADHAWRLDVAAALREAGALQWHDGGQGWQAAQPALLGDVVLGRKDIATSYHLAVVLDDAAQGVTLVTRGADLFAATHLHRLLQALLGLPVPRWHHHRLVTDDQGQRLAKRHDALSLRQLRSQGMTARAVQELLAKSPMTG